MRAGSGLAWVRAPGGRRLVVVQDDASFLALVEPPGGAVTGVPLPAGPGGARQFDARRGTKAHKLDLEACLVLDDGGDEVLLALGSGSTDRRERVVVGRGVGGPAPDVRLVSAPALYALLRAEVAFSGSELNVEGAARDGDDVVLFQRGNGAARSGRTPVDATCRLDAKALLAHLADPRTPPPPPRDVVAWALGEIDGVRLTFTDAAPGPGGLRFLAAAEDSPDTYDDGHVTGVVVGVLDLLDGDGARGRWTPVLDPGGAPLLDKAEGLALDPDDPGRAWVVIDADDPDRPADLCEVRLTGPWEL